MKSLSVPEGQEPNLDPNQEQIWREVSSARPHLQQGRTSNISLLLKRLGLSRQPEQTIKGIFLYGSVGSGKTLIMRRFASSGNKVMLSHFQDFMQQMHHQAHKIQKTKPRLSNIDILATEIASKHEALCLDEFEIKDITDAMLVRQLFAKLADIGVFIFLTSNTQPINLYSDGLKRELFLPFIEMITQKYKILALDNPVDYRSKNTASKLQKIFYLYTKNDKVNIKTAITDLIDNRPISAKTINLFGRQLEFPHTCYEILLTNFDDLCRQNLSYVDFVAIAENFEIVILQDVPKISENQTDLAIRFINLIDNLYFQRKTIFISLEAPLADLHPLGHRAKEFTRTISRLKEMASNSY